MNKYKHFISYLQVLFDLSVCNPVQVIIPVDTTSTIEEMKQHVVDTVTAVVSKVTLNIFCLAGKKSSHTVLH